METSLLPREFIKIGWAESSEDLCWMRCPQPGYRRVVDNHEIFLCLAHIVELENTAVAGYSQAKPPQFHDNFWWPWEPINDEIGG